MYSEWKDLVQGAQEGNRDLQLEILQRLRPLIISSIKNYYNRREDYQELIQEANLCILDAIKNFDPNKKVHFLGYVKLQLKYLFINKNRTKSHSSLNVWIGDEAQEELVNLLVSSLEEPIEGIVRLETQKDLRESFACLTGRQWEIVELFYGQRKSIGEIGEILGIKYRTVVNIKTHALEKLRSSIEKYD